MTPASIQNNTKPRSTFFGCVLPALVSIAIILLALSPFIAFGIRTRTIKHNLIHHADHKAILAACRELMERHPDKSSWDPIDDGEELPKAIQELHSTDITVRKDCVLINLHGGFWHFGVIAYRDDLKNLGDTKLIDGLMYSED